MGLFYYPSTPTDEPCWQLGAPEYTPTAARAECQRTIDLLRKLFGSEPSGARLRVGSNAHDFGTYYDVQMNVAESDPEAVAYAYAIDGDFPKTWDDERVRDWRAAGVTQ